MQILPRGIAALLIGIAIATGAGIEMQAQEGMTQAPYRGTETPAYALERSDGALELRNYGPRIVAEVSVTGARSQAISAGFRILAGYIFGGNEGRAKVAMTAPVAQAPEKIDMTAPVAQSGAGDSWTVQFTMPAQYDLASLPVPNDPRIRLIPKPADRQAVIRFSGLAGTAVLEAKTAELRDWAAAQGLGLNGAPMYYFYDDPFTLPWNRRNEVAFDLAP